MLPATGIPMAFEADLLSGGCPSPESYTALLARPEYLAMRSHSVAFLELNSPELASYGAKWSVNPLEHWSRRWEYAFATAVVEQQPATTILDAGSGLTFFPSYLAMKNPNALVTCADIDSSYIRTFGALGGPGQERCQLLITDVSNLAIKDEAYDVTLCISVLEHMPNFPKAARELGRVTRTGGLVCVTFDLDLRPGAGGISLDGARTLLRELGNIGDPHADYEGLLDEVATRKIPVSQKWVKVHDRRERSWADRTKHWLYTNAQLQKLQNLTFFCCTYTRG